MKKLLIAGLLLTGFFTYGQKTWVGFSIGANHSQLRYKNTKGVLDENLKGIPGGTASIFLQTQVFDKKKSARYPAATLLSTEIGYKSTKIKDKASTILTTWSLHYLTANLTLRRKANSKKKVNPFYGGGLVADWFASGTQNLGFEQYDLKEELQPLNFSITAEAGLTYFVGDDSFGTLGLSYLRGISNLETSPDEQALLHSIKISMAIFFGF